MQCAESGCYVLDLKIKKCKDTYEKITTAKN